MGVLKKFGDSLRKRKGGEKGRSLMPDGLHL